MFNIEEFQNKVLERYPVLKKPYFVAESTNCVYLCNNLSYYAKILADYHIRGITKDCIIIPIGSINEMVFNYMLTTIKENI